MNTDQPLDQLAARLAELRDMRDTLTNTRSKEDVRALAESWLASAGGRANGTAVGFVLNQRAGPAEVQAVLAEFLLESPALVDFLSAKVEATTDLTSRQRDAKVKKLDEEIGKLQAEQRRHAKAAALAEVEAQFGAVA
jgi:hypothetical protein